jgi:deoxyribonuclease (pyrimidine dimer)
MAARRKLRAMTRINCVPVQELTGPHLVAEYRELPRVFALVQKAAARGTLNPRVTYTLGAGHLLFFYTRLGYLVKRHAELVAEMRLRGYKPSFDGVRRDQYPDIPEHCWNDWTPTAAALSINRQRLAERIAAAASRKSAT